MSSLSQFAGGARRVAAIINSFSSGGVSTDLATSTSRRIKSLASGALTAGVLGTVLNITGRGQINLIGAHSVDATSRTIRLKVTADGLVIFDATTNVMASSSIGLLALGYTDSATVHKFQPLRFSNSLLVQIASSLTETDKINTLVNYEVDA